MNNGFAHASYLVRHSRFRTMSKQRIISASELGEYSYCSRAWWLKQVVGEEGDSEVAAERTSAGVRGHEAHGRSVRTYQREGQWLRPLWLIAALVLLIWLVSILL